MVLKGGIEVVVLGVDERVPIGSLKDSPSDP